jgi:tetratricopeptide (TPR) repeat protein
MKQKTEIKPSRICTIVFLCLLSASHSLSVHSQNSDSVEALNLSAQRLIKQQKYTEALPILEELVAAEPNDPQHHFYLGFALIAQANVTKVDAQQKAFRIRARNEFVKSKELGNNDPLVDGLIGSLSPDGSDGKAFSANSKADDLMKEAEALFSRGKLDEALDRYQNALKLDPTLYEAALFCGDVFTQRGDFANAEIWYQKAISIDPTREIAYRYSATPFMRQQKYDEARDRYVEAYICEPYSKFSISGISQWAEATHSTLAHPKIDFPTSVTFDEKGDTKINLDSSALIGGKDDGSFAWISYGATRANWRKEKFAKTFPGESIYRHSLSEEAGAIQSVLALAIADKKVKSLSPALAMLKKLSDEGLLEAYILLARPDQGIVRDHAAYLKQNRDKLRRYVVKYVLPGGGES